MKSSPTSPDQATINIDGPVWTSIDSTHRTISSSVLHLTKGCAKMNPGLLRTCSKSTAALAQCIAEITLSSAAHQQLVSTEQISCSTYVALRSIWYYYVLSPGACGTVRAHSEQVRGSHRHLVNQPEMPGGPVPSFSEAWSSSRSGARCPRSMAGAGAATELSPVQ